MNRKECEGLGKRLGMIGKNRDFFFYKVLGRNDKNWVELGRIEKSWSIVIYQRKGQALIILIGDLEWF